LQAVAINSGGKPKSITDHRPTNSSAPAPENPILGPTMVNVHAARTVGVPGKPESQFKPDGKSIATRGQGSWFNHSMTSEMGGRGSP
jgi:hypothetical protein